MYNAADDASRSNQSWHFFSFAAEFAALILISIANSATKNDVNHNLILTVCVALFVGIAVARRVQEWERKWYQSRALAESIKTMAWRFSMKAVPFDISEQEQAATKVFREYLAATLKANRQLGNIIRANDVGEEQITTDMLGLRLLSVSDRKDKYLNERVDGQQSWYSAKSADKLRSRNIAFFILFLISTALIVSVFLEIEVMNTSFEMFDPLLVLLTGLIGWVEVKRFGELSASYGLTSHEIGLIRSGVDIVQDEKSLSDYVNEAERAFSREHTQWLARSEVEL